MSDCKPIISRKFIKTGGTEFDVLMGDGSVKDIRDLETFHGEHKITGTTIPTSRLISFLESWGSFTNTGSSVYIKMTDTIIPNSETAIGDIPLGKALIITYRVDCQILMWVHADNGNVYKYRNYIWSVDGGNSFNYITTSDVGIIVPGLDNGLLNPSVIPDLPPEIIYGFTLDDLNSLPDKDENTLYIDLNTRRQYYWNGDEFVLYEGSLTFATKSEAEAGIIVAKVMSPKTTKDAIEYHKVTANILGSTTLHGTSTNDTGIDSKVARKDHSHKIEGFSLTGHTHNNVLLHRPLTGDVVNMGTTNVIPIDATTFRKKNPSDFADHRQGELADTSIQDVKIGGVSTKKLQDGKFIATLSKYPENKDFRLRELKDVPTPIVTNKVLVTTSNDGFEFKDYKSTLNYPTELTNLPTISVDAVNPTNLSGTPKIITGNLVLHPIVTAGTIKSLTGVQVEEEKEDDILQYKRGKWINTPLVGGVGEMENLVFNNLGSSSGGGECPVVTYDGTIPRTISYNTIGAAPSVHTHNLAALTDVLFGELAADDILTYSGTKWTNTKKTAIATLKFNDLGSAPGGGGSPVINYNGTSSKIISFNTIGAAGANHTHGNITNDGRIGTTPDLIVKTSTNGTLITLAKGTLGQFLGYDGKWATPSGGGTGGEISHLYSTAFVHEYGSDTLGVIGNHNKPFKTIQGALEALKLLSTLNNVIEVFNFPGGYHIPSTILIDIDLTIKLREGVEITYQDGNGPLFNIAHGGLKVNIIGGISTKIKCVGNNTLSSFLEFGECDVVTLDGIYVEHQITKVGLANYTTISGIVVSNLIIKNSHIYTNVTNPGTSSVSNIRLQTVSGVAESFSLRTESTKLTIINSSAGGRSVHVDSIEQYITYSFYDTQTIQILPNFVNPTQDPAKNASSYSPWTIGFIETKSMSMSGSSGRDLTDITLSNCVFYIANSALSYCVPFNSNKFLVWPLTSYKGTSLTSVVDVCRLGMPEMITYVGPSIHNYGSALGTEAITSPPNEYGSTFATSLVRCPLSQPYPIEL